MEVTEAKGAEMPKTKTPKRKIVIATTIAISIIVVVAVIYFGILKSPPLGNVGVSGIYDSVSPSLAGQYIELKPDGTAYFKYSGYGATGTWELKDGNRIFVTNSFGAAGYMVLNGDTLTPEGGGPSYVKRK
jgi:hypothetical protein